MAIDISSGYLAGNLILASIVTLVVLIRVYTRIFVLRIWKLEDYMIVVALALGITSTVIIAIAIILCGIGWPDLSPSYFSGAQFRPDIILFIANITTTWSACSARISTVLFLNHALEARRSLRNLFWGLALLQLTLNLVLSFLNALECSPFTFIDFGTAAFCTYHYLSTILFITQGAFNAVTDFFLTVVLAIIVWKTRLKSPARLLLTLLLCMSIFAGTSAIIYIVRTFQRYESYSTDLAVGGEDREASFQIPSMIFAKIQADLPPPFSPLPLLIWASLEQYFQILTPSLYVIAPMFVKQLKYQSPDISPPKAHLELDAERNPILQKSLAEVTGQHLAREIMTENVIHEIFSADIHEASPDTIQEAPSAEFALELMAEDAFAWLRPSISSTEK